MTPGPVGATLKPRYRIMTQDLVAYSNPRSSQTAQSFGSFLCRIPPAPSHTIICPQPLRRAALRCRKSEMLLTLKGIGFTGCEKTHSWQQEASGHDFTAYGRIRSESQEASGHDFSRAVNATKKCRALAPEGCFSGFSLTSTAHPSGGHRTL